VNPNKISAITEIG
jgi:dsDNA-binding SOS-regulon protein